MGSQYGITPPISISLPTDGDIEFNNSFLNILKEYPIRENKEQVEKRERVLALFNTWLVEWSLEIAIQKNINDPHTIGVQVHNFGSYRLGVQTSSSDMDLLCIVPQHCTRQDFFTSFPNIFQHREDVSQVHVIQDAYVVIKILYSF